MLKELIYNYFEAQQRESNYTEREKLYFSPSSLTACKRQLFYKYTDTQASNPISTHAYIKMQMGTTIHAEIEKILKEIGIYELGEELKTGSINDVDMRYRVDGLLRIDDKAYVFELKTVYASGYNTIEREPKKDHIIQLLSYMIIEKIDTGILLYIGRDNGFMVEYKVEIKNNELLINSVYKTEILKEFYNLIAELEKIKDNINNNILPERDYKRVFKNYKGELSEDFTKDKVKYKSDWQCSYCKWKDLCYQDILENMKDSNFYIGGEYE